MAAHDDGSRERRGNSDQVTGGITQSTCKWHDDYPVLNPNPDPNLPPVARWLQAAAASQAEAWLSAEAALNARADDAEALAAGAAERERIAAEKLKALQVILSHLYQFSAAAAEAAQGHT